MKTKDISLTSIEFIPLVNLLNEICYGLNVRNFENKIGVEREQVIDLKKVNQIKFDY